MGDGTLGMNPGDYGAEELDQERRDQEYMEELYNMEQRYAITEKAKIGSQMQCPFCGIFITKTTYNKKFCHKGCKDKYWNNVNDKRRDRSHAYSKGR